MALPGSRPTAHHGPMTTITVGISGTTTAHPALAWAVERALSLDAEVQLVHVIDVSWGAPPPEFIETALLEAEQKLHHLETFTAKDNPGLRLRSVVRIGAPVAELVEAADTSDLLVVGSHRAHGKAEHASSHRPARIAAATSCSVVVIPDDEEGPRHGVVVGVDGSQASDAAVAFAAKEADRLQEPLSVIFSWMAPEPWTGTSVAFLWPGEPRDEDRLIVAEAIAGLAEDYPDLVIESDVVLDDPANALLNASSHARMLVVGNRGRHGLAKVMLGSVSEAVVWGQRSPVAVVR